MCKTDTGWTAADVGRITKSGETLSTVDQRQAARQAGRQKWMQIQVGVREKRTWDGLLQISGGCMKLGEALTTADQPREACQADRCIIDLNEHRGV